MGHTFQISWFGIVWILLIVISVGAILLKLLAGLCRLIVNSLRSAPPNPAVRTETARIEGGFLLTSCLTFVVCLALAAGIFLLRTSDRPMVTRSGPAETVVFSDVVGNSEAVNEVHTTPSDVGRELRGAFQDLQGARDNLRTAIHGTNRKIHVEVNSESAAVSPPESNADSTSARTTAVPPVSGSAPRPAAEQAEDESSGVVVFDLSPEATSGNTDGPSVELLNAINSKLPEKIRRTYALIPLSAPGYPVSAADRSLQAAEVLQAVAASLIAAAEKQTAAAAASDAAQAAAQADAQANAADAVETAATSAETNAAPTEGNAAEDLMTRPAISEVAEVDESQIPTWLQNPDGGRIVVETPFQPAAEDNSEAIRTAVNEALLVHLRERTDQTLKPVQNWDRFVHVSLTPEAAKKCVVATYDRKEVIPTREGPKSLRRTMALIEFPEDVDNAALAAIRKSVQQHRISGVATATGAAWLAVMTGGLLIRFGRRGGRMRKLITVPAFALVSVPLFLAAVGITVGMSVGTTFDFPWENSANPVVIGDDR